MKNLKRKPNTLIQLTEWFSKKDTEQLWIYLYNFIQESNKSELPPSPNTIRSYRRHFRYFCEWSFEQDLQLVFNPTREFLLEYFEYRRRSKPNLSEVTLGSERSPIRKFYDALIADEIIDFNMFSALGSYKQHHRRDPNNIFTEEEIQLLLSVCNQQDITMILLGVRLGVRTEEIASLSWNEVDIKNSRIRVSVQIGKKDWVKIGGKLLDSLVLLKEIRGKSEKVVGYTQGKTIRRRFAEAFIRAGIDLKGRTFSGLRNTWHEAQKQPFVVPEVLSTIFNLSEEDTIPPKFEELTQDLHVYNLLYERWNEAVRMYEAKALRFTIVALGAVFEGALVALLRKHWKKIDMKTSPPNVSGVPKDIQDWKFSEMIDYAQKDSVGWLHEFNGEYADKLRDYRNFVHPALELSKKSKIEERLCRNLFDATKHIINDLIRSQAK